MDIPLPKLKPILNTMAVFDAAREGGVWVMKLPDDSEFEAE